MRIKTIIILFSCFFFCFCNKKNNSVDDSQKNDSLQDTIIGSQIIRGNKYAADKIIAYSVIIEKDTSYVCAFVSKNKNGKYIEVCFDYHLNGKKLLSYQKRIEYFRKIVRQRASKDFDLFNVSNLYFGLLHTGELAIDITRSYERKSNQRISTYEFIEKAIFDSRLKTDLENIFSPYSLVIDSVVVDDEYHINLRSRENMYKEVEVDTVSAPKYILNCPVKVYFKAK